MTSNGATNMMMGWGTAEIDGDWDGSQKDGEILVEILPIAAAANSQTAGAIPANSVIKCIGTFCNPGIPGDLTYSIGTPDNPTMFATDISGAQGVGNVAIQSPPPVFLTATQIVITPSAIPSAGTGLMAVSVWGTTYTAPDMTS
jgi:hypothetical protein